MKLKSIIISAFLICISYSPIASAGIFDGIAAAFDFPKKRLESYSKVADKQLVDQFYYLSEDGKIEGLNKELASKARGFEFKKISPSTLTLQRYMFKAGNMQEIVQTMNTYSYSPLSDEIGRRYVAFANSRGNVVKLYKPALGNILNQMFVQNFALEHAKNTAEWIGLDNALIEFTSTGQIVSVMTRSHQAIINIGVNSIQFINLYFGKANAQVIENRIANNNFENNFIRVLTAPSDNDTTERKVTSNGQDTRLPEAINTTPGQSLVTPADASTHSKIATSPEQRIQMLKNLAELKQSGVLTEQEFAAEKRKILEN
ncbi:hypothetical protein AAKU61_003845 [Undibacterium sp. GrIS 1.2]|uniref:SHOCT domain-containing protein n=1 Tax=Undibacterium sp. GrIS 1.2 TaxID=3143933 RepID=UPI003399B5F6